MNMLKTKETTTTTTKSQQRKRKSQLKIEDTKNQMGLKNKITRIYRSV